MMKQYGLIGYPLSHSFSPQFFTNKFKAEKIEAEYKAYSLHNIADLMPLIRQINFSGLNVTIPYKETIIPYLDKIDTTAMQIGAVNTIKFDSGKTIGYNTDVYGFEKSLLHFISDPGVIKGAFVLGSGGASRAVGFVLKQLAIPYKIISRAGNGRNTYQMIDQKMFGQINLIVNTTPLGMYPDLDSKPDIPYGWLNENYFLYDLIYNPEKTIFLSEGFKKGCKIKNGLEMLVLQAEQSWQIWNQPEM